MRHFSVLVYASSSAETPADYTRAAEELGRLLANESAIVISGGGKNGCMGALNTSANRAGAKTLGVIHRQWVDGELAAELTEMRVVDGNDLGERKRGLLEEADCVVALPGGTGTLDEILDVLASTNVGLRDHLPVCLLSVNGYYDGLIAQLRRAEADKLVRAPVESMLTVVATAEEAVKWCVAQPCRHSATVAREARTNGTPVARALGIAQQLGSRVGSAVRRAEARGSEALGMPAQTALLGAATLGAALVLGRAGVAAASRMDR